jgi:hypothetical protein
LADTVYGRVTTRRLKFRARAWWFTLSFGESYEEDIPIRHVTLVRLELKRWMWLGLLFLALALITFSENGAKYDVALFRLGFFNNNFIGLIMIILAGLLLWGSPRVVINTTGGDLRPITGWPWQRSQAKEFITAAREELFREERQ